MIMDVSVQYNGGLFPDIVLLTICDYIGEPFKYHVVLLSLQPMFRFVVSTFKICVHNICVCMYTGTGVLRLSSTLRYSELETNY